MVEWSTKNEYMNIHKKLMNKKCCTSSIAQGVYLNGELSRKNTTHDLKGGRMLQ